MTPGSNPDDDASGCSTTDVAVLGAVGAAFGAVLAGFVADVAELVAEFVAVFVAVFVAGLVAETAVCGMPRAAGSKRATREGGGTADAALTV